MTSCVCVRGCECSGLRAGAWGWQASESVHAVAVLREVCTECRKWLLARGAFYFGEVGARAPEQEAVLNV